MAGSSEYACDPEKYLNISRALDLTEESFFRLLLLKYPTEFDFNKLCTLSQYCEFRQNLATKYLSSLDHETLKKVSINLALGNTSATTDKDPTPDPKINTKKSVAKNRRRKQNKSSKKAALKPASDLTPLRKRLRELGWPEEAEPPFKRPVSVKPCVIATPARPWVSHMPIVRFQESRSLCLKELVTIQKHPLVDGKFASRPIPDAEYRHSIGCHTFKDHCDICDVVVRYHYFEDFKDEKHKLRLVSFIAFHHWIDLGQSITHFNWHPQTWQNDIISDGKFIHYSGIGAMIGKYIDDRRVVRSNVVTTVEGEINGYPNFVSTTMPPSAPEYSARLTR